MGSRPDVKSSIGDLAEEVISKQLYRVRE